MNKQILSLSNWHNSAFVQYISKFLTLTVKKKIVVGNYFIIKSTIKSLQHILFFLNKHSLSMYKQLIEIAVEDTPKHKNRFRINYILSTMQYAQKFFVSVTTDELSYLPSVA